MNRWTQTSACSGHTHCVACRTDVAWRQSLQRAGLVKSVDFDCPHGVDKSTALTVQTHALVALAKLGYNQKAAAKRKVEMEAQGRAAWAWLHTEAGKEALTAHRLQAEFMPMIPAYGCACKREWQEILAKNPLPTKGQAQWAVDRHNDINVKLGKPLWPYGVDKDE